MKHITKLILRVVINKVCGRTLQEIEPEQYGFMLAKGTRSIIFVLKRMSDRGIEKKKEIYAYLIDYSKAFDKVGHEPLIDLLKAIDVHSHDVRYSPTYTGNK